MLDVDRYYRTLELSPGATAEEIHQSYKDLALVWHPDRFMEHPRLQQKAHGKLQEINEAHEQLRSLNIQVQHFSPPQTTQTCDRYPKQNFSDWSQFYARSQKEVDVWLD